MTVDDSQTNDQTQDNQDDKPNYTSVNDLDYEMSEADEKAFVEQTLGITGAKNDGGSQENLDKTGSENQQTNEQNNAGNGNSTDDEKSGEGTQDAASGDSSSNGGTDNTKDDKTSGTDDQTTSVSDKDESATDPKPTTELDENGIQTDDLWVEVEDSEGKSHKLVYDPQNPGAFLPSDFTFKDDKQLFEILDAKNEMTGLYKERLGTFEKAKAERETQTNTEKARDDQLASWDAEIEDLMEMGTLERPKVQPDNKDWLGDPAVKRVDQVFKFMKEENEQRIKDGKAPIKTFGSALARLDKQEKDAAEEEAKKKETETVKQRGALVGGASAASAGTSKPKVYKSGSYGSIWDIPID